MCVASEPAALDAPQLPQGFTSLVFRRRQDTNRRPFPGESPARLAVGQRLESLPRLFPAALGGTGQDLVIIHLVGAADHRVFYPALAQSRKGVPQGGVEGNFTMGHGDVLALKSEFQTQGGSRRVMDRINETGRFGETFLLADHVL